MSGVLDSVWQDLPGNIMNAGVKEWLQDASPAGGQRFYRIVSF